MHEKDSQERYLRLVQGYLQATTMGYDNMIPSVGNCGRSRDKDGIGGVGWVRYLHTLYRVEQNETDGFH
jgi:hypothetical protein